MRFELTIKKATLIDRIGDGKEESAGAKKPVPIEIEKIEDYIDEYISMNFFNPNTLIYF